MGGLGCVLFLVERRPHTGQIVAHASVMVGEGGIEPEVWYTMRDGQVVPA